MNAKKLSLIVGVASLALGLYYFLYPVIEAEARMWGLLSMLGGVASILAGSLDMKKLSLQGVATLGYAFLAMGHLVATWAWISFPMITDKEGGLIYWQDRLHLVPHLLVALFCFWMIREIYHQ